MSALDVQALRTGFRQLPEPSGEAPTLHRRLDPFPHLERDWMETWAFSGIVAPGATAAVASPVFHGPAIITEVVTSDNQNAANLTRFFLGIDNNDADGATPPIKAGNTLRELGELFALAGNAFPLHSAAWAMHLGTRINHGVWRLVAAVTVLDGLTHSMAGHVTFAHLLPQARTIPT